MSPSAISGTASCTGASIPCAPFSSMPSGRSRNMKWRSAGSPNGTSVRLTAAGWGRAGWRGCGGAGGGGGGNGADRRQQILHEREVDHLLGRDMGDHPSPAKHRLERVRGETLVFALLEGEGRDQVLAHDP